jgi:hypothetical protein
LRSAAGPLREAVGTAVVSHSLWQEKDDASRPFPFGIMGLGCVSDETGHTWQLIPSISVREDPPMKNFYLSVSLLAAALASSASVHAQTRIYRCSGNAYTNNAAEAQTRGCKLVEGGNVTVVEGTRVNGAAPVRVASVSPNASANATSNAGQGAPRVESSEQRARDSDARLILESELKKAEARHAELLKEFNNGEPEKLGPEHRNHQKWLDRVADLKASIARNESDIAGIRRELGRAAPANTAAK